MIIYIILIKFDKSLNVVQYYYNRLQTPYLNNFDLNDLNLIMLDCCVLSGILYSGCSVKHPFDELNKINLKLKNIGYLGRKNKTLIVSMVSTANIYDVFTSIDNELIDICHGRIHNGYYKRALKCLPVILKQIKNVDRIYLTGHSMGGALVSILAYLLHDKIDIPLTVFTFGSPKYGDKFLKDYLEFSIPIHDIINQADPVIHKPLNLDFVRIGRLNEWKIDTGNDNVNHGIKAYRECVLKVKHSKIPRRPHRLDEIISRAFLDWFQ